MRLRTGVKHTSPGTPENQDGGTQGRPLQAYGQADTPMSVPYLRRIRNRVVGAPCLRAFDDLPCRCRAGCELWQQNNYHGPAE